VIEDETVSMERVQEAAATQNNLAAEKIVAKEQRLENLKAKAARNERVMEEQRAIREQLEKELEDQEGSIETLGQTLRLNEKMVTGIQTRVYEQIKRRVRLRMDGALANRQFDFANAFVSSLEGSEK
jgi:septal ring factor EnvC (AmiA/AmiB activator)